MDKIIPLIVNSSATEKDLKELASKLAQSSRQLNESRKKIDDGLRELKDNMQFTVGRVFLLAAKAAGEITDHNLFTTQVMHLVQSSDPQQIALARPQFAALLRQFSRSCLVSDRVLPGLHTMRTALSLWASSFNLHDVTSITTLHVDLLLLAIKAKCYHFTLDVLEKPLLEIDPVNSGLKVVDYLSFCYYGGMVFTATKKHARALEFFQLALTMPTKTISYIQVCCYKKYILVSLILYGEVATLPGKLLSAIVASNLERVAQPYSNFATQFARGIEQARKSLETDAAAFIKDQNLGLVKQAVQALQRQTIQRLTSTYMTISLQEIATNARLPSPEAAENLITRMIEEGSLHARINQKEGVVVFIDDVEQYDSRKMAAQLDQKIAAVLEINKKLNSLQTELELRPELLMKEDAAEPSRDRQVAALDRDLQLAMEASLSSS